MKEWHKLAPPLRNQSKRKLAERAESPHLPAARLRGCESVYKIKLRTAGYRLLYEVVDEAVVICVLVVGKREQDAVYNKLITGRQQE